MTVHDIVDCTRGKLLSGDSNRKIKRIIIDSRSAHRGDGFVAIKGHRLDGHRFVAASIRKNVSVVVVSKKIKAAKGVSVILVEDTVRALGDIARMHRSRFTIPVMAVIGSAGKTTTKDITAKVLSQKYRVLRNQKSENNHIGVPLTLLKLTARHQAAVLELGTNQPGDIRYLAKMARPTAVIFTNIGASHLKGLKSVSGVFKEKTSLLKYLPSGSQVVYNRDDDYLRKLPAKYRKLRFFSYALDHVADCRGENPRMLSANRWTFALNGRNRVHLNTPVYENIYNTLAGICCGRLFGIRYNTSIKAVEHIPFPKGRQRVQRFGRAIVIDDTYNANPVSFRSAVNTLMHLHHNGKKIVVCADMLELGERCRQYHMDTGAYIARTGPDYIFSTGRLGRLISQSAGRVNPAVCSRYYAQLGRLHRHLKSVVRPGDAVLVKASRSMRLERTVEYLRNLFIES